MLDQRGAADLPLPLDVSARVEGLFSLAGEIRDRVSDFPVLLELVRDFQDMAREYILLFEERLQKRSGEPPEKWLRRHEMLDKLTEEWHTIYSLASATVLGSSYLEKFKPYVNQAVEDIGLEDAARNFLLIPIFGAGFSLVTVRYSSSNVSVLNLPISVIHSPWELSVIWHEMAGLKVIRIREHIRKFLDDYARANQLTLPDGNLQPGSELMDELFRRLIAGEGLEDEFRMKIRDFLTAGALPASGQERMWSQDWFEQLYEDACSVFAFGEEFVSVLRTILSRQAGRLKADRRHPDLETRIQVARRLLELRKGGAAPPESGTQRLTDELLWAFIQEKRSDQSSALPAAYAAPGDIPPVRRELNEQMRHFNEHFGDLEGGKIHEIGLDFGSMGAFAGKASQAQSAYIPDADRSLRVREKLLGLFGGTDVHALLKTPFSPSDELDIKDHNHALATTPPHDHMSINVHGQDHTVFWWGVSHV